LLVSFLALVPATPAPPKKKRQKLENDLACIHALLTSSNTTYEKLMR
jgi:hypothetical protein